MIGLKPEKSTRKIRFERQSQDGGEDEGSQEESDHLDLGLNAVLGILRPGLVGIDEGKCVSMFTNE